MTKAGRPPFRIVSERLLELRKQAKLTQKALGESLFGSVSTKSDRADPRTPANSYQRIERTGQTSKKTAQKIAEILAQKLGDDSEKIFSQLCGGQPLPPPDRIEEIEKQLLAQLDGGNNLLMKNALARHADVVNPVRSLAVDLSSRLEVAQLEQRNEELNLLAELTGWTLEELLRPTSLDGYWLLTTNTMDYRETQILLGVSEVLNQVMTEGSKWLGAQNESDVRVELSDNEPWMRVLLMHPLRPSLSKKFSFVRCVPSAQGLQWVRPSEWDRWKFEGPFGLVDWSYQHANFVKEFHAESASPRNLSKLRLIVQRGAKPANQHTAQDDDWWETIAIHKGCLDEYPEQIRDDIRAQGDEHALVTNWLASGLWEDVLSVHLGQLPPDWWEVTAVASGAVIRSKLVNWQAAVQHGLEPEGRTFRICLVEESESGELAPAPWREGCRAVLVTRVSKELETCKKQISIGPRRLT